MQTISKTDFDSRFDTKELYSILEQFPELGAESWLCSGSIRRIILGQNIEDGDLDFFFISEQSLLNFKSKITGIENEKDKDLNISFDKKIGDKIFKIQLIKLYYPIISFLFDNFDFTLCQTGFDGSNYYFGDFSLKDIIEKKVIVNKITYPISSFRRIIKYSKQGFWVCPQQIEKFLNIIKTENIESKVISVD